MNNDLVFPVRINRYLAHQGLATRRAADRLIEAGRVTLNGEKAKLGDKVQAGDQVELLGSSSVSGEVLRYVAYYKPRGIITHSPQQREKSIEDVSSFTGLFPVGRLDKESEGLILLTNDGRVTDRLLHPRYAHEKEYRVRVREKIESKIERLLEAGVMNEGERLTAKKVTLHNDREMSIILTEGKKHQIRRMLSEVHLTVERLVRVRIMSISLGALTPGMGRKLKGRARVQFLADLDLR